MVRFGLLDAEPFHEPAVLLLRQLTCLRFGSWPLEHTVFQPLIKQHKPVNFPVQRLDAVTASATEQKKCVCERIQLKLLRDDTSQTVNSAPQIRVTAGKINFICPVKVIQHGA